MLRSSAWLWFLLLSTTLAGCLELDGQQITVRFDPAADRIDLHVVHRGLFAEGKAERGRDPLARALADLDEVRATGKVALWSNFPFVFDPTRTGEQAAALLAYVDVENGGLFTDADGVLCGHQLVRIRGATAFVRQANGLLAAELRALFASDRDGRHRFDDESRARLDAFLQDGGELLAIGDGRIEVRLPLSARDHAWLMAQFEERLLEQMTAEAARRVAVAEHRAAGGPASDTGVDVAATRMAPRDLANGLRRAPSWRFFWDNDVDRVRAPGLTTIGVGVRGQPELRLVKASDGLWHPALLEALRARGEKIEAGVDDEQLAAHFAAFRERDPVLPPKLAELRAPGKAPR